MEKEEGHSLREPLNFDKLAMQTTLKITSNSFISTKCVGVCVYTFMDEMMYLSWEWVWMSVLRYICY